MSSLKSKIESLLFISAKPMTVKQLSDLAKKEEGEVRKAGDELVEAYKDSKSGIQIIKNGSKFQMVSSPENTKIVQDFIQDETTGEISRPSLETLTIIAFRGPISKIDLDRIRGVNCSLIVRNLLIRGLIEAKTDKLKEQTYYNVTLDFIRFLGINDVSELPDYEKLSKDDTIEMVLEDEESGNSDKKTDEENAFNSNSVSEVSDEVNSEEEGEAEGGLANEEDDSIIIGLSESNDDDEELLDDLEISEQNEDDCQFGVSDDDVMEDDVDDENQEDDEEDDFENSEKTS